MTIKIKTEQSIFNKILTITHIVDYNNKEIIRNHFESLYGDNAESQSVFGEGNYGNQTKITKERIYKNLEAFIKAGYYDILEKKVKDKIKDIQETLEDEIENIDLYLEKGLAQIEDTALEGTCQLIKYNDSANEYVRLADNSVITREEDNNETEGAIFPA